MIASFVIGFHTARIDNLLQTLRFLTKDHQEVVADSHLSMVCQDTIEILDPSLVNSLDNLRDYFHKSVLLNLNLPYMQLPFVTNKAMHMTETDKVIILESDRILPKGYFAAVIEQLDEGKQITCCNMKKLTKPASDEEIETGSFEYRDESRDINNQIGVRNMWSGNTAIWKTDYYKAGQMDETYLGYGWADSDMTNRMERIGIQSIYRDEIEFHLWHPSATYGEGDQKQMFINNGLHFCRTWNIPLPPWFRQEIAMTRTFL